MAEEGRFEQQKKGPHPSLRRCVFHARSGDRVESMPSRPVVQFPRRMTVPSEAENKGRETE